MNETVFSTYYWIAPTFWIVLIILNQLLGDHIATINNKMTSFANPEYKFQARNKINSLFLLRALLAFPVLIFWWWFFTRSLNLQEIYLLIVGCLLLSRVNAIIFQIGNLLLNFLFRYYRLDTLFSKDEMFKTATLKHIGPTAEYFSYLLIYLLVVIFTQSWFFAGGSIACIFDIGRHLLSIPKMRRS